MHGDPHHIKPRSRIISLSTIPSPIIKVKMATPMANPTAAERFLAVNELLEQVFLFIPPGRLLHSVQLVSRHFREVIHDTQSLREHHWVAFSTGNRIQPARTRKELQQRLVPNKSNPHFFTVKVHALPSRV